MVQSINIAKESEILEEARFRLDEDSICYGCTYYENVEDVEANDIAEENISEGEICDCKEICIGGNMNGYRMNGLLIKIVS